MEDIIWSIKELERMRDTHKQWIDYLNKRPEYPTKDCGSVSHHKEVIEKYNRIIQTLCNLL